MRSVRRGIVTAALALPMAFGAAGVAAAHDDKEAHGASYEAECASAGPKGASTCEVESESGSMSKEKGHHKHHDKHHGKKEAGWASYEKEGAKANYKGAKTWEIESSAWYVDKK